MKRREVFLAREAEIQHQSPAYRWRTNETERHTLGQLLRTMLGVDEVNFLRLRVVARDFWETDVLTRREDDGTALFVCESATLIIEMTTTARQREEYVVYLHAEDEAEGTLYMRVTLVQPTLSASPRHSLVSAEAAKTSVGVPVYLGRGAGSLKGRKTFGGRSSLCQPQRVAQRGL